VHTKNHHIAFFAVNVLAFALVLFLNTICVTSLLAQKPPNDAFGVGESLRYTVRYGFVTAGTGAFTVMPTLTTRRGVPCYDVRFEVRSLKNLDWLYRVYDTYRTLMDTTTLLPLFFEQHNREGRYQNDTYAEFDHARRVARTSDGEFPIDAQTFDVVSALFYVRTLSLTSAKRGDVLTLRNFIDGRSYDLKVRILGRETVETQAGTFRCISIEPLVVEGGLFKSDGKIVIHFTDDARKIPVKVTTKVLIGAIDVELTSWSGVRGEIAARVK
jgi:Protein of unknown function (DUF3108)